MVVVGDVFVDKLHGLGHFFAIGIEFHVVEFEVEDIPGSRVDRFIANSIFGFDFRNPRGASVGLEPFLRAKGHQLVSNDFVVFLEVLHPGEL